MEQFFEEQYIVHQFIKVIRSKRYLFSKHLDDIFTNNIPTFDEINQKTMKGDPVLISQQKREKFLKRGTIRSKWVNI
jgi:hypothetical protein